MHSPFRPNTAITATATRAYTARVMPSASGMARGIVRAGSRTSSPSVAMRRWPPPEPASYRLGISVNDIVSWRLCGRKLVTRADHICYGCTIQLLLLYQYMVYYLIYADV